MFETDEGIYMSSTTILSHEIDHANEYDKNPEQYEEDSQPNSDEQFGNKEERRACENEQKTAEKHGEVKKGQTVRKNHTGGEYLSNCGASPEEQSKVCRVHNEVL